MKTVLEIFFGAEGTRPILMLICLLFAGVAGVVGMGTLLPLASQLVGGPTEHSSPLNGQILGLLTSIGITPTFGVLIVIISAFIAIRAILTFAALSYAGIAAAKVAVNIRRKLIATVFDARWSYYTTQPSGKFANALSVDSTRAGEAYLVAAQAISHATQVVAFALITMLIDWRLALVAFAAGLLLVAVFYWLIKTARRASARQNLAMQKLAVLMVDILASIKPLKSMSRYQQMTSTMGALLTDMRRALVIRELSVNGMTQGSDLLVALLIGLGVYLASSLWRIPLPELVVSGVMFYQIVASTSKLQRHLQAAAVVENSYIRVIRMIEKAGANKEVQNGKLVPQVGQGCRLENISLRHGKRRILSKVTIDIPANQLTVLQGPSGAGKTTIVDLLIGLHQANVGRVLIGGTPISEVDITAWRRQIGYVPQEINLLHTTIRENITLGDTSISDEQIVAALELVGGGAILQTRPEGLDASAGEMGGKLSGGQRQRISMARALVVKPQLLLLDEVTSALDPETEREIVNNVAALKGKFTIVAITHRPAWTEIADRLYQVEGGTARLVKPVIGGKAKPRKTAPRKAISTKRAKA